MEFEAEKSPDLLCWFLRLVRNLVRRKKDSPASETKFPVDYYRKIFHPMLSRDTGLNFTSPAIKHLPTHEVEKEANYVINLRTAALIRGDNKLYEITLMARP